MPKSKITIEIVISTNKSLSSMSLASREGARIVLAKKYANVRITEVNNRQDLAALILRKPDLAFLGMKYVSEDPILGSLMPSKTWLSQQLFDAGISYTGSGYAASKLEHNKQQAKQRISDAGIATASSQVIRRNSLFTENDITIPYPIFVKPVTGGGGSGIDDSSLIKNFGQLRAKVQSLSSNMRVDSLLETYLPGREFSLGILRQPDTNNFDVMPIEIEPPMNSAGARFLTCHIKRTVPGLTSAVTDKALSAKLSTLAFEAFCALGAQDYGRIDVRLDSFDQPHFLEANLLPSLLNNYGNMPRTCMLNIGLSYEDLLYRIVELALERTAISASPITIDGHYAEEGPSKPNANMPLIPAYSV